MRAVDSALDGSYTVRMAVEQPSFHGVRRERTRRRAECCGDEPERHVFCNGSASKSLNKPSSATIVR
jgi:hypothetical protein